MDSFFSEVGIPAFDFVQLSTFYLVMMLNFFALKDKNWLNHFLLLTFVLQCIFFILFHQGLNVKLFAALMCLSALIVQFVVIRRRKRRDQERSVSA
jgi:hypothetical protein